MKKALLGVATVIAIMAGGTARSWAQVGQTSVVANCKQDLSDTSTYNGSLGVSATDQYYDSGSGDSGVEVICPVANGSYTKAIVSGFSAAGSTTAMNARVCVQAYSGGNPVCGTPVGPSTSGEVHFQATIPTHVAADFIFLQIRLFDGGGTVWGYALQ